MTSVSTHRSGRRKRAFFVGVLLVLALGTLLTLQWRWSGELAAAQREETRRVLQAAVERMASEFQTTLAEVQQAVLRRDDGVSDAPIPLVAEVVPLEHGEEPPGDDGRAFVVQHSNGSRSLVVLDAEQLATHLFPALAVSSLGADGLETYRVSVVAADGSERLPLYRSHAGASEAQTASDASALLRLHPNRWVELGDDGARWLSNGTPVFVAGGVEPPASWRIEVRHAAGSLEKALARSRLRNSLLGGGVLATLIAGLAFLWIAEQRARSLAERELAFVAGVSHELRTPLAVVRTASSNLARGIVAQPAEVREYGRLMECETERVSALVERVLRFSGDDAELVLQDVDLGRVITSAVERCAPWRDRRRFAVAVEVDADACRARADGPALTAALHNLIENAIKYGPEDQTIHVESRRGPQNRGVVIEVADEGPGVAPRDRARLFEPFFRGSGARGTDTPGSGLGLGVAREIARAHGGDLELAPNGTAGGAVFRLCLPATPEGGTA